MDMNGRVSRNNPIWDSGALLQSLMLTATSGSAAFKQLPVEGSYCIISNTGAVTLYVGNDADGIPDPGSPGVISAGGPGVAVEPNATFEFAVSSADIYIRNNSPTTSGMCSILWFQ